MIPFLGTQTIQPIFRAIHCNKIVWCLSNIRVISSTPKRIYLVQCGKQGKRNKLKRFTYLVLVKPLLNICFRSIESGLAFQQKQDSCQLIRKVRIASNRKYQRILTPWVVKPVWIPWMTCLYRLLKIDVLLSRKLGSWLI